MSPIPRSVGPFPTTGPEVAHRSEAGRVEGVDAWRDILREHFVSLDVGDTTDTGAPFAGDVRSTLVGHLSAAVVSSTPQSCVRTRPLTRADPRTYLQVGMMAEGTAVLEQDGREAVLRPGTFAVYETDRPFSWHFDGPWTLLVLTWPRETVALGPDAGRAATARVLGDDGLGRIVGRAVAETALAPPPDADGDLLADQLAALVATTAREPLYGGEWLSPSGAADLRRRVETYVGEHLEVPELGPEEIARAHFVSVRALHRAFADADETVARLIRRRRLEHGARRLIDPRHAGRSVTEIAFDCGFGDLASFSRAFKCEFHEPPASFRRRIGLELEG